MNVLVSLDVKLVNLKAIKTRANREEGGEEEKKESQITSTFKHIHK